jgi:hypothetical protein
MSGSRIIGSVPFVDGVARDVHEDADGRQWVTGYEGEMVYGVWLLPADEPVLVDGASS